MSKDNYCVIMAGGTGSRFWPLSRQHNPKQFQDILGIGKSLIRMTYERLLPIINNDNFIVVTTAEYKNKVKEHIPELTDSQILVEPERKNTAAAITLASLYIKKLNPTASMLIAPADHMIIKENEFTKIIKFAFDEATGSNKLITIGIRPNRPETGYGYIQYISNKNSDIKKVKTFTEKPQIELAQSFLLSGDFLWNSGMFIWTVEAVLAALEKHLPDLYEVMSEAIDLVHTADELAAMPKAYSQIRAISIDYGLMEKAENVYVIPGEFGWSDLGSWNALYEVNPKDEAGNLIQANSLLYNSKRNYIKGANDKLILVHSLDDYLVADCDDVLLICPREMESEFRNLVNDVKNKKGNGFT